MLQDCFDRCFVLCMTHFACIIYMLEVDDWCHISKNMYAQLLQFAVHFLHVTEMCVDNKSVSNEKLNLCYGCFIMSLFEVLC